jgi:hypothetical protein
MLNGKMGCRLLALNGRAEVRSRMSACRREAEPSLSNALRLLITRMQTFGDEILQCREFLRHDPKMMRCREVRQRDIWSREENAALSHVGYQYARDSRTPVKGLCLLYSSERPKEPTDKHHNPRQHRHK